MKFRVYAAPAVKGLNHPSNHVLCLILAHLYCSAKAKGSICLLVKLADTAFRLCTAILASRLRKS